MDTLKEWLKAQPPGTTVPLDAAAGADQPQPPRGHVLAFRMWEFLCMSYTAFMEWYTPEEGGRGGTVHPCSRPHVQETLPPPHCL